jgi:hypothetical protein
MNYFRNEKCDNAKVIFVEQGAFLCAYEREGQSLDSIAKLCGLQVVHPDPRDNSGLTMVGFPKTHLKKYTDLLEANGYSITM